MKYDTIFCKNEILSTDGGCPYELLLTAISLRLGEGKNSPIFFVLPLDKCGRMWYNKEGVQRAGNGSEGPNFRSDTPICKFFATSSDFSYALDFPVKLDPAGADRGVASATHMVNI